ncbi:MAG: ribonuclease E/G [Alphaproteobacteria bacterium]
MPKQLLGPKQLIWLERPGQVVAALYQPDQYPQMTNLSARQIDRDFWSGSLFIGRLMKEEPTLGGWLVDIGQQAPKFVPALVPAHHMDFYAKTKKLKLSEGLYAPFTVVAEARSDESGTKGVRLQPVLNHSQKISPKPACLQDLRDPIAKLAAQENLDPARARQLTPKTEAALYTELKTLWQEAIEPKVAFAGGSLIVEPTSALTTIDVNGFGDAQAINQQACQAIADTVLSRNISGQILVDFASMPTKAARLQTLECLQAAFTNDTRKLNWGGVDGFCCLLFSRQRIGPSTYDQQMVPANAPETGLRLDPLQQLVSQLDQVYCQKLAEPDWAKRKAMTLATPLKLKAEVLETLTTWMAQNAFIDLTITSSQTPDTQTTKTQITGGTSHV